MVMSTAHAFVAPLMVVNCHCTPVSRPLSTGTFGLPPIGAPTPMKGIMTVAVAGAAVIVAWGAYEPIGPPAFGSGIVGFWVMSACWASLVEYCIEQPAPVTVPLMSN